MYPHVTGGDKIRATINIDGIWHRVEAARMPHGHYEGHLLWMGSALCGASPPDRNTCRLHDELFPLTCVFCIGLD